MTTNVNRSERDALMRWEDDGGAPVPENNQQDFKPARSHIEMIIVALAVIIAHFLPFAGVIGCPLFASNGCESIAVVFSFLAAFMLTVRVLFQDNDRIRKLIITNPVARMWGIEAIGAAVLVAWVAPCYAAMHGMAEASIAALGIGISILASAIVSKPTSWLHLGHDLASVLVVMFAFAWSLTVPHFSSTPHGEEFLAAVAIGSSSLHSFRTAIEVAAKCLAK
jgi:hypothetical protein